MTIWLPALVVVLIVLLPLFYLVVRSYEGGTELLDLLWRERTLNLVRNTFLLTVIVTAGTIAQWRERVLAGGQAAVKSRPADERDDELGRLRAKVGELTMENELLRERARRAEGDGGPFGRRRSR